MAQLQVFKLVNQQQTEVTVTNFGASIYQIKTLDRHQNLGTITVTLAQPEDLLKERTFLGATVGPFAGRIWQGKWTDQHGQPQTDLEINDQPNAIHGGSHGFDTLLWQTISADNRRVVFQTPKLPDYPGLRAEVTYELTDENALTIKLQATTSRVWPLNPTNHTYFNLRANEENSLATQELQIRAQQYYRLDEDQLPLAQPAPVQKTDYDLRQPTALAEIFQSQDSQLRQLHGLNHPFILADKLAPQASLTDPVSGRTLSIQTDRSLIIAYTANHFDGHWRNNLGQPINRHAGVALECQELPDAWHYAGNQPTLLTPERGATTLETLKFGLN
ncbi:aldose epimerase family protein [Lapidilactobacillus wuchangensis]|uniref:aldose epimerase family protein n=1 Tax=Lapidilactobacillus wuchangensis TaxID=2486001 RepID=UPI000F7A432F|nr:aldose epimerase family protein [Lapidilactobacillus wuchangensis]